MARIDIGPSGLEIGGCKADGEHELALSVPDANTPTVATLQVFDALGTQVGSTMTATVTTGSVVWDLTPWLVGRAIGTYRHAIILDGVTWLQGQLTVGSVSDGRGTSRGHTSATITVSASTGAVTVTIPGTATAAAAVAAHVAATDPHGDRSYAAGLVSTEAGTRASADSALDARLDAIEGLGPLATDAEVTAAVGAEATARAAADTALDARLDTLETDPTTGTAVAAVAASVTAEAGTRASADTALDGRLDAIEADYTTSTELATAISNHAGAADPHGDRSYAAGLVSTEAGTRASADSALDARLDAIEGLGSLATDAEVTSAISTHAGATDPHGDRAYTDSAVSAHIDDTTDAHDATAISYAGSSGLSATTVEAALDELDTEKAPLASPTFTGTVAAPTPTPADSSTKVATTAFVATSLAAGSDGAVWNCLPNFAAAVRDRNDAAPTTLRVISLGSSVGRGDGTDGPGLAGAPGKVLTDRLTARLDLLGNLDLVHTEGSVAGHTLADVLTDYAAAKTAAGGAPVLVPLYMGMNDGGGGQYYTGMTLSGVKTFLADIIAQVRADGADLIVYTTPHPHSGRYDFSWGGPYSYPGSYIPDTAGAKVTADWTGRGTAFAQSYRHHRVNQAMRAVCAEHGVLCVDAERYWFDAVLVHGENALFGSGESVHPNTLGHTESYARATADLVDALSRSIIAANMPVRSAIGSRPTYIGSGGTATIPIPANTAGRLLIAMTMGGGWHSAGDYVVVAETTRVGVSAAGNANTGNAGNAIASVAGSGSSRDITLTATAVGAGGTYWWRYEYDSPF